MPKETSFYIQSVLKREVPCVPCCKHIVARVISFLLRKSFSKIEAWSGNVGYSFEHSIVKNIS